MEESSCFKLLQTSLWLSLWFLSARRLIRSSYPLIRFIECTNPLQIVLLLGMNRVFPIWVLQWFHFIVLLPVSSGYSWQPEYLFYFRFVHLTLVLHTKFALKWNACAYENIWTVGWVGAFFFLCHDNAISSSLDVSCGNILFFFSSF